MKLRSIPPANRTTQTMQTDHRRPIRGPVRASYIPRVVPKHRVARTSRLSSHDVTQRLTQRISGLEEEIETWRDEFGEQALLLLYEEKSRLEELVRGLHKDIS